MPLLFSYGTLQEHDVQLAVFGRALAGRPDTLVGFEPSRVAVAPSDAGNSERAHYANASYTGNPEHRVGGTVFEVADAELSAADIYEREAEYVRVRASLMSGQQAWVYVHARSVPPDL